MNPSIKIIESDVLIIGGGAAGCFNAIGLAENKNLNIVIVDKSNIRRSGCLAAGVNALNAYISKSESPESFLEYVKKDSEELIRDDLVLSIARRLNEVTRKVEAYGLPIFKDENDEYVMRGKRSIKINGENIKPILEEEVRRHENINVKNNIMIIDYLVSDNQVFGAYGISEDLKEIHVFKSKVTVCATGGASGIYKPNNPGHSKHKMWYSPFNTGAGYAMGIRAGAEMTTFEMRFIALRCKGTIAPTGTIAQGVKASMINENNEKFLSKYAAKTTSERLHATINENLSGSGPVYLQTKGISKEKSDNLIGAYLNMAPSIVLKWFENNENPSTDNVEVEGTEPYIVGGHTGSGYWIDLNRKTNLKSLYAIGDVAGGSPKKYVTGCFAEADMATEDILKTISSINIKDFKLNEEKILEQVSSVISEKSNMKNISLLEDEMQEIMDKYAGGISTSYRYSEESLNIARYKIKELIKKADNIKGSNYHEIKSIFEIKNRLLVSIVLIEHMKARKETRWKAYQENVDYPKKDDNKLHFINSRYEDGNVNILIRDLVRKDEIYEH